MVRGGGPHPKTASGSGPVAVSHHHLATQAALEVMAGGGNAVDAAIVANAVTAVVLPTACGPGGDLFALVHRAGDVAPACLNASGRAGSGSDAERLRSAGHTTVPYRGQDSITVPGCVDGWVALSERFGRLPIHRLLEPAISLAEEGFPASPELAGSLEAIRPLIGDQPSALHLYPEDRPPRPGHTLVRPDLATTLRTLAEAGRAGFYLGPPGRAIVETTGGRITEADLGESSAEWVEPLGVDLFGRRAWTVPPNSQGYLTLAAAWLVERSDLPSDFADPRYTHLMVEAYRAVAWERDDLVADPAHAPLPPEALVDPGRLEERLGRIDPERTATWPDERPVGGGTTYLCTIDGEGTGVSLIQSNFAGIGSGLSAGDTGVFLQNRGAGFNLIPGHPNELAPGKRPLHTLAPTLWTHRGRLHLLLGTRGGHWQPQVLLQVLCHLMVLQRPPADAQRMPRWTLDGFGQGTPSRLRVEEGLPETALEGLRERGHSVEAVTPGQGGWGPVSLIAVGEDGTRIGAADPRVDTAAAGVATP